MRKSKAEIAFERDIANCVTMWKRFPMEYKTSIDQFKNWVVKHYDIPRVRRLIERRTDGFELIMFVQPDTPLYHRLLREGFETE